MERKESENISKNSKREMIQPLFPLSRAPLRTADMISAHKKQMLKELTAPNRNTVK